MKVYTKKQTDALLAALADRAENISPEIMNTVSEVISNVTKNGDAALRVYKEKFDKVTLDSFYLSETEKEALIAKVPDELKRIIDEAAANIFAFHEKQKQNSWMTTDDGKIMGQIVRPLEVVGLYVPGGTAAYPSSVLMNAIPAKVAGVEKIVIVTPPKKEGINPAVIYAAKAAGITDIIQVGGAQAVAALAYGTESVPRVDKIVGPGNIFVAMAKKLVFGAVDIDMIAGPSEVLVIADERANPSYVAADLMSQAEHDPMAASILITTSKQLADDVHEEINRQKAQLSRCDIIDRSLDAYGSVIIVDTLKEAVELSNKIAPEHLELSVENPFELLALVKNAGSIFLGDNAPEPLGDYFAGPNHVLPTNGTARFSSALGVDSFIKKSSYLYYNEEALKNIGEKVVGFARAEGLTAHANSILRRLK
ncbi:MAG: histidinol dehydrogenase [Clostridia bacterium]|nr:histidinol dehydrogenase [Clostridia bacterium]